MRNGSGCSPKPKKNNEDLTEQLEDFFLFNIFYSDTNVVPTVDAFDKSMYMFFFSRWFAVSPASYLFNIFLILFFICTVNYSVLERT